MANGESGFTLRAGALLTLFTVIFGFFFIKIVAQENRITKTETILEVQMANINKSLESMTYELSSLRVCCYKTNKDAMLQQNNHNGLLVK